MGDAMPHCCTCNSTYDMPGTCNCYAAGGRRSAYVIGRDARGVRTIGPAPLAPRRDEPRCAVCTGPLWRCQGRHVQAIAVPAFPERRP